MAKNSKQPAKNSIQETRAELPPGIKLRHTLRGHDDSVLAVVVTADGKLGISGSVDNKLKVWELFSGREVRTLKGHSGWVNAVAVTPDGKLAISGSDDETLKVWELSSGGEVRTLEGHDSLIHAVAVTPDGKLAISGSADKTLKVWEITSGREVRSLEGHRRRVNAVAVTPDGKLVISGSSDNTLKVWELSSGREVSTLEGHSHSVYAVAVTPDGKLAISGSRDRTLKVWDLSSGGEVRSLEGHSYSVTAVAVTPDGKLAISGSNDKTLKVWEIASGREVCTLEGHSYWVLAVAVTPDGKLAICGSRDNTLKVWELDADVLLGAEPVRPSVQYSNAKVVLVGESSTGKTCLARALMGMEFQPQESTHGMHIWTFDVDTAELPTGGELTRETFLWDLAGQADYQVVHQLFLDETALGLVLFDPSHPDDPFGGVGLWEKSLHKIAGEDCPKLLVAGRVDRGHPMVTPDDIEAFRKEHMFEAYIATSGKTGAGVDELKAAIGEAVPWGKLSVTSSPELWNDIREYLLERRTGEDVLTRRGDLREAFKQGHPDAEFTVEEFDTVIGHAQAQGLLWRLSFGDFVLLKPELLNAYASAIVRVARNHPQGLGSVKERDALDAKIDFEDLKRLADTETERSMLHAVVELFLERQVALRESEQLVFPSKFNRELPDFPEPPKPEVVYRFQGNIEDIYATLAVRLYYSETFKLKDLYKDAAEFLCPTDRLCGFQLERPKEGWGKIITFFGDETSVDSKILFLKFIHEHLKKKAISKSVVRERVYRCPECGEEVQDRRAVAKRIEKQKTTITCSYCDEEIPLIDILEEKFADPELMRQVHELDHEVDEKTDAQVGITRVEAKKAIGEFDVFLCHNSADKLTVKVIGGRLIAEGIRPWLDEWELRPGVPWQRSLEEQIEQVKSAAVFVGKDGIGPWQEMELEAFLREFVSRGCPVIPVLLPSAREKPKLPVFLKGMKWVDYRKLDPDPFEQLIWGITGERPKEERIHKGKRSE